MEQCDEFSIVTQKYLDEFYRILDTMVEGMTGAKRTNSISYNFMVQMIPHHRGAIEMSENILKYTTDIQVQNIALGIIEAQTKSISDMQKIECVCNKLYNSRRDLFAWQNEMNGIMRTMFAGMKAARADNRINCNFMWEMIPHHMGAVRMSQTTLEYRICGELVPILQAIIESQQRGIEQMQNLLSCLECGKPAEKYCGEAADSKNKWFPDLKF